MVTTTEPRRSPDFRPSRRTLLASAALVAPASLLPAIAAVAAEQPVDPHPAWVAEWEALIEWQDTTHTGGRDLEQFPQYHRTLELEGMIGAPPPARWRGSRRSSGSRTTGSAAAPTRARPSTPRSGTRSPRSSGWPAGCPSRSRRPSPRPRPGPTPRCSRWAAASPRPTTAPTGAG